MNTNTIPLFALCFFFPFAACSSVIPVTKLSQDASSSASSSEESTSWTDRLVSPVSAPVTFETPVVNTELRPFFLTQELPETSIFGGGNLQIYAVQARYALTDRLALLATKDGYVDFNPDIGRDETGWADLAAGFKYALVSDPEDGILVTPGVIFETDSGSHDVFQGNGDGVIRPFVSAGLDMGKLNFVASIGFNQPLDGAEESTSFDYHGHVDYQIAERFFPLFEVNGITYTSDGSALPVNFEGGDMMNLGSGDVKGNTVVTGAVGGRYAITDLVHFGAAWEFPLSSRNDLLKNRLTVDMVWMF